MIYKSAEKALFLFNSDGNIDILFKSLAQKSWYTSPFFKEIDPQ